MLAEIRLIELCILFLQTIKWEEFGDAKAISFIMGTAVLSLPVAARISHDIENSKKAIKFFESRLDFEMNPYGVKTIIEGKAKSFTIVDVRLAKDFTEGHIPGAININIPAPVEK